MKIIKNIKDFLHENVDEYEAQSDAILEYCTSASFSRYLPQGTHKKDLEDLKKHLSFDLGVFMSKYRNKIYEDGQFTMTNGFLDYLLYTYDNSYELGGGNMFVEPKDYLLKYLYGFQTFELGIIYILQYYKNIQNFYKDCADKLLGYLLEDEVFTDEEYDKYVGNDVLQFEKNKNYYVIINSFNINQKLPLEEYIGGKLEDSRFSINLKYIDNEEFVVIGFGDNVDLNMDFSPYIEEMRLNNATSKYNM